MTEPPIWPPPPDIPEPLSANDDFLAAQVRNSTPRLPLSRLRLVKNLRQETGQDLRHCLAVVNNFCDRHAILMPLGGFWIWGAGCLLPLLNLAVAVLFGITAHVSMQKHDAAVTYLERMAIESETINIFLVLGGVSAVVFSSIIATIFWRFKKMRHAAAEARAKFA